MFSSVKKSMIKDQLVKSMVRFFLIAFIALSTWQCGSGTAQEESEEAKHIESVSGVEKEYKRYNIGAPATMEEIAGWDIDVRPDGEGLPLGSGTAEQGEPIYETKCAVCHGSFGEGVGRWPKLAGGEGSLTNQGADGRPEKSVGSYWPYASTLFDYIRRAMPYPEPMSLSAEETYAISAYVLYLNDLIDYDFVLDKKSLPNVRMPNRDNFYIDDRPDVKNTACMENCKDVDSITVTSSVLGVTPISHFREGQDSPAASHDSRDLESTSVVATGKVTGQDEAMKFAQGRKIYQSNCAACHQNNGKGLPPSFPSLHNSTIVMDLAALLKTLLEGREATAMQSFASMSNEDLAELTSFIRSSWGNNASAVTSEQVGKAR